ncbi:H(+)/Cl(-) exchange transporter ClcA [uncultured Tolumonas sp.]|uniref:H(+)/Cl(-) exchange transporter ClcA n=1 Tax=uncultured Tolumonas sp. TaxID=263765 RepID=UPI002931BBF4|nr:H(+)/Cl(-) exchange transporter ClcA [uncultured Tolumonas sp.]
MATSNPIHSSPARRRQHIRHIIRRFVRRDYTSPKVLILAVLTGILTGTICALFEFCTDLVVEHRMGYLEGVESQWRWVAAFIISGVLAMIAFYLMHRFAPEAGGSGIPEIEGALDDIRPVRWKRVLPVKFLGGTCSLGSGMILGREGPSVQIGGNVGKMVADLFRFPKDNAHALLAAGAAAGLASAFNAPLAGILFVLEEMRPTFRYSFLSIKVVSTAVICSTITRQIFFGTGAVFVIPAFKTPSIPTLMIFLIFGCVMGSVGFIFNKMVNIFQDAYLTLHQNRRFRFVSIGVLLGGLFGVLSLYGHGLTSGGMKVISQWVTEPMQLNMLFWLLVWRFLGTLLCFCSGVPGGIFAPSLALGTLCGALCGTVVSLLFPELTVQYGVFPIVGMGALFAASVRAPVTGIVLVTEMTNNYALILPMMVTTLSATLVAQWLGGKPIYSQILERTLRLANIKRKQEEAHVQTM